MRAIRHPITLSLLLLATLFGAPTARGSEPGVSAAPELYAVGESIALPSLAPGERSVVFVGDLQPWGRMQEAIEKHGVRYPFAATAPLLQAADFAVGNLETPVAVNAAVKEGRRYAYKAPPRVLPGIVWAGFDLVSLANNHLLDCGPDGVRETLTFLEAAGLAQVGAGADLAAARRPYVARVGPTKIAFVATVSPETRFHDLEAAQPEGAFESKQRRMPRALQARRDRPGTVVTALDDLARAVAAARKQADLVVVYPHWGVRYHRPPYAFQRTVARTAIDAGADLVIGHHAHIWQPVELYAGKPVVYGLGNFAFGSRNRRADAALLARAVLAAGRIVRIELVPLYTKNRDPRVAYQTKVLKGASASALLRELRDASAELGATLRIDSGIGVLDLSEDPPANDAR